MNDFLKKYLKDLKINRKKRNRTLSILCIISALVVIGVCWKLRIVGITMSEEACCGKVEHTHTEDCYVDGKLVCGLEEHHHTLECYSDKTADIETKEDWESTITEKNTGNWSEDILKNAKSQIGYVESSRNFIVDEDGETRQGYSRYGAWYGEPYCEWNAVFVSFCAKYADIPKEVIPQDSEALKIYNTAKNLEIYEEDSYKPHPGDIVFLQGMESQDIDKIGIVNEYTTDQKNGVVINIIEGDFEGSVAEIQYQLEPEKNIFKALNPKIEENSLSYKINGYINIQNAYEKTRKEENQKRLNQLLENFNEKGILLGKETNDKEKISLLEEDLDSIYEEAKELYIVLNPDKNEEAFQKILEQDYSEAWGNYQNVKISSEVKNSAKVELKSAEKRKSSSYITGQIVNPKTEIPEDISVNAEIDLKLSGSIEFPVTPDVEPAEDVWSRVTSKINFIGEETEEYNQFYQFGETNKEKYINLMVFDIQYLYGETELDVSKCDQTVSIKPTENILHSAIMPISTFSLNDTKAQDTPKMEKLFKISVLEMDEKGVIQNKKQIDVSTKDQEIQKMTVQTKPGNKLALAVTENLNPKFTVQYYANTVQTVKAEDSGTKENPNIMVLDTRGKKLPKNNKNNPKMYLELEKAAESKKPNAFKIKYQTEHSQLFLDKEFNYNDAPGIEYIDIVSKVNTHYKLTNDKTFDGSDRVWVYKDKKDAEADRDGKHKDLRKEYSKNVRFTNGSTTSPDTVQIEDGMVIRLVYEPSTNTEHQYPVQFWDYDLTDGTKDKEGRYYTAANGINSGSNYDKHGQNDIWYTFGNGNTGVRWDSMKLNGYYINKANTNVDGGCSFGLMDPNNPRKFSSSYLDAPNFMGPDIMNGKTPVQGYKLGFHRNGDTYILRSVTNNRGVETVGYLSSFVKRNNWNHTSYFYANDFWPLDEMHGKDPEWGPKNKTVKYAGQYGENSGGHKAGDSRYGSLPATDDDKVHNPYFGMLFDIDFTLAGGYVGPLEYMFFGDDDLWVYLQELDDNGNLINHQLICDVGGVHSSVGEYVDLWDYIAKPTSENQKNTRYRLRCIYTERGASGSTCYMNFTLPNITGVTPEQERGLLWLEKEVEGPTKNNGHSFDFKVDLSGVNVGKDDVYGYAVYDNYTKYDNNNSPEFVSEGTIRSGDIISLQDSQFAVIKYIPEGASYVVTEVNKDPVYFTSVKKAKVVKMGITADWGNEKNEISETGVIGSTQTDRVHFTNRASYELPHTGGTGIAMYILVGIVFIFGSIMWVYKIKRKGRR